MTPCALMYLKDFSLYLIKLLRKPSKKYLNFSLTPRLGTILFVLLKKLQGLSYKRSSEFSDFNIFWRTPAA